MIASRLARCSVDVVHVLLAVTTILFIAPSVRAQTSTTCDAANPFSVQDDRQALQDCLNNYDTVYLHSSNESGYLGYHLSDTLYLSRNNQILASANGGSGYDAWIFAFSTMPKSSRLLAMNNLSGFLISHVQFNGNREDRGPDSGCSAPNTSASASSGFTLEWFGAYSAVCGSGLVIQDHSSGFVIHDSVFYDNGADVSGNRSWADGITVNDDSCTNATIRDSDFWENTDVALGVNGGSSCSVYRNHISNYSRYGFAGLVAGDPCCSGGDYSDNDVASGDSLLSFGIFVGVTPWSPNQYVSGVQVYNNSSDGSVITLAVDDLSGGDVYSNSYSNNRGSHPFGSGCGSTAAYTVGNLTGGASVQGGYSSRTYSSCSLY